MISKNNILGIFTANCFSCVNRRESLVYIQTIKKWRSIGKRYFQRGFPRYSCYLWLIIQLNFCLINISCSAQKPALQEFSIEREGRVIAVVKAEIASTPEEKRLGLMHRENLPDGQGMLFVYERDDVLSFWMSNTIIPLSIAFIASDGRIIDIKDMYPHDKNNVTSSRSVRYALEVPQGWFSRAGIREGDIVIVNNEK